MTKRRVVTAILVAVAIWPLLQMGLASRLDLDPESFFGFAEHAIPRSRLYVHIVGIWGTRDRIERPGHFTREFQRQLREYERSRAALGVLLPPHRLAPLVMEEKQQYEEVKFFVFRDRLHPTTRRIEYGEADVYTYERLPDAASDTEP